MEQDMKNLIITRTSGKNARELALRNVKFLNATGRFIDMRSTTEENKKLFDSMTDLCNLSIYCAYEFGETVLEKSHDKLKIEHIFTASDQMQSNGDLYSLVGTRIKLGKKHGVEVYGKPCDALELAFFINENRDEIKFKIIIARKKKKFIINSIDLFQTDQESFTAEEFWKRVENKFFDSIEIDGEVMEVMYAG